MTIKKLISILGLIGVAACGGAGDEMTTPPPSGVDTPATPTISRNTIVNAESDIGDAFDLNTNLRVLVGSATFNGAMVTDLDVDGQDGGKLYGDVSVRTNAVGGVSGSISNLHIATNSNTPVEALDGSLNLSGNIGYIDKDVEIDAAGTVTGVFGDGQSGTVNMDATLGGKLVGTPTLLGFGGEITDIRGPVNGSGSGSHNINIDGQYSAKLN